MMKHHVLAYCLIQLLFRGHCRYLKFPWDIRCLYRRYIQVLVRIALCLFQPCFVLISGSNGIVGVGSCRTFQSTICKVSRSLGDGWLHWCYFINARLLILLGTCNVTGGRLDHRYVNDGITVLIDHRLRIYSDGMWEWL